MDLQRTDAEFSTTSWTLIETARDKDHPAHERAMDALIRRYWPAAYAALRRMGRNRDEAAELTQAFFVDVVLARKLFDRADAQRGRLRSLLLTALKRYVIDKHRRHRARPDQMGVSLDKLEREEGFLAREPAEDVDQIFERRWAMAMLEETLARCERYFHDSDRESHWAAFDAFIVKPAFGAVAPPSQANLAVELGFPSATHVASAMKIVRKRFRLLLREVVAETAETADDQEAEYARVVALLS